MHMNYKNNFPCLLRFWLALVFLVPCSCLSQFNSLSHSRHWIMTKILFAWTWHSKSCLLSGPALYGEPYPILSFPDNTPVPVLHPPLPKTLTCWLVDLLLEIFILVKQSNGIHVIVIIFVSKCEWNLFKQCGVGFRIGYHKKLTRDRNNS